MYKVESNQYLPLKGPSGPSGLPLFSTYYYVANGTGQKISKNTGKPYRGKQMREYAFYSEAEAQTFLNQLNKSTNFEQP